MRRELTQAFSTPLSHSHFSHPSLTHKEPHPAPPPDAELDGVRRELTQARAAATREERKLRELKDEQKGLQENLGREYGAEGEFTQMVDKCFEAKVGAHLGCVCVWLCGCAER